MNLEKISEISIVFESFKQDPNAIYHALANISKTDLSETHQYYTAKSKHFKIDKVINARAVLLGKLLNNTILNDTLVDNVKRKIQNEATRKGYEKDIFHSWSPNWRILYPIYYNKYRPFVLTSLKLLANKFIDDLGLKDYADVKIVDFNGPQHFGKSSCWLAIYNKSHKSQKTALQLFFKITCDVLMYGLYDFKTKNEEQLESINIKQYSYNDVLNNFRNHIQDIINDVAKSSVNKSSKKHRKGTHTINVNDYLRKPVSSTLVEQKHKQIQQVYYDSLVGLYGEGNVELEENFIDIKVETETNIYLYEVKTYDKAIYCIRDAIGQLLLYSSRLIGKTKKQIKLIVVGLGENNLDSTDFQKYLYDNFKLDFDYEPFKLE